MIKRKGKFIRRSHSVGGGFTMIELLVAMVILVIAFGLVTYLYTRAARIRRIVVVHSEMQQALSQMTDILTYGERNSWGLIDSTGMPDDGTYIDTRILVAKNESGRMTAGIIDSATTTETTLTIDWGGGPLVIVPEEKIRLLTADPYQSKFEYYDSAGKRFNMPLTPPDAKKVTFVKITLWAQSTDPAFRNAPPVPFITGVRLRNKPSL